MPTWQSFRTAGGGAIQLLGLETKRHWGNTMKALDLHPTPELKGMYVQRDCGERERERDGGEALAGGWLVFCWVES